MRNHRPFITAFGILAAFCFMIVFLITSVEAVAYWTPGYYETEYTRYQVLSDLPEMTMDDLLEVTDEMMAYLRGNREDLHVFTTMGGEYREFFNAREIAHMEDVRGLFLGGLMLRRIALGVLILWAISMCVLARRERIDRRTAAGDISRTDGPQAVPVDSSVSSGEHSQTGSPLGVLIPRSLCIGTGAVFAAALVLAGVISTDFSKYFIVFHHIFFNNDLWLLDPRTDMLINIVPEGFFMDTAFRIGLTFLGAVVVFFGICLYLWRKQKGKKLSA